MRRSARLAQLFDESKAPKGHGFIIRTAGEGASKRDIQADLKYLDRLWCAMQNRMETEKTPGEIYLESDLVIRALRDLFGNEIVKIVCDSDAMVRKIKDFLSIATPRLKPKVMLLRRRRSRCFTSIRSRRRSPRFRPARWSSRAAARS